MKQPETFVLVTGASRGFGLAISNAIAKSFPTYHVFRGCRHLAPGPEGNRKAHPSNISDIQLDVTKKESIRLAVQYVTEHYGKLDIIINNAGVSSQASSLTENLEECISTNLFGSARVTEAFLPLLKNSLSARLIFVTSVLGSISARNDPTDPFSQLSVIGYRTSKAALNMLLACFARELDQYNIKVFGVCPGFLATELNGSPHMMRKMGAEEPEVGAKIILDVLRGERDIDMSRVVYTDGVRPW